MAQVGGSGSGQNNETEDRSYFGQLTERFLSKYGTWREEDHIPQTKQEYDARLGTSQTGTCARLGALYFEMQNQGVRLSEVRGIDSHVFEQKWLSPDNDRWLCFHSNFSACFDGEKDIRYFFAELTGIKGPQLVTRCVRLSKSSGYSVGNCRFCTGLWHPSGVNFLGCSK